MKKLRNRLCMWLACRLVRASEWLETLSYERPSREITNQQIAAAAMSLPMSQSPFLREAIRLNDLQETAE